MVTIEPISRPLGARATAVLEYIKKFIPANQFPPTVREIQAGCDFSSTSVVNYQLKKLEQRGHIELVYAVARGIRLIEPGPVARVVGGGESGRRAGLGG